MNMMLSILATLHTIFTWYITVSLMIPEIKAGVSLGKSVMENWMFVGFLTSGAIFTLWAIWR